MEVILLDKIGRLGALGDKVNVKAGYGRNYLIPYNLAVPATKANLEAFETRRAHLEQEAQDRKSQAQARADQLSALVLNLVVKAGEEGKLFGSIGARDLAEAIEQQGVQVAKSEIRLPQGPIRVIGEYQVGVQLHAEVATSIRVLITAE